MSEDTKGADAPKLTRMPRSVAEIHYARGKLIKPGTVITDEVAAEAKLSKNAIAELEQTGAIEMVEVYQA